MKDGELITNHGYANTNGDYGGTAATFTSSCADGGSINTGTIVASSYDGLAADKGGSITFGGRYITSSTGEAHWAKTEGLKHNATSNEYGGYMAFRTRTHGTSLAERMRIDTNGDLIYGGTAGVHEKYFSGNSLGSTAFSHDITHTNDSSQGTFFHIQASFTHHPSYDCALDTYVSRRGTSGSSTEQFRRDTATSGAWSVTYVSATVTRVTKSAGNYGGGGPYWIKAVWKNN